MVQMTHLRTESAKRLILLPVVVAVVIGLVSGLVGAYIFAKPGPQGIHGLPGETGAIGPQGIQGEPGLNGTNTIQQMLVS